MRIVVDAIRAIMSHAIQAVFWTSLGITVIAVLISMLLGSESLATQQ